MIIIINVLRQIGHNTQYILKRFIINVILKCIFHLTADYYKLIRYFFFFFVQMIFKGLLQKRNIYKIS